MNFRIAARAIAVILVTATSAAAQSSDPFDVLVFSRTEGFRHASIEAGIAAVAELGLANNFSVVSTEDDAYFTANDLSQFRAIVFLNTTADVLDPDEEEAMQAFIRGGGGFVGVHSAADTEYDWPWYGELVGAYFDSHPAGTPTAVVRVVDRVHPATTFLPFNWQRTDEWYNYRTNPRGLVHVLMTLDESTYSGGTMGADHPIAWCRDFNGGRTFYTGGGHTTESYQDPDFRNHLLNGILFAAGVAEGNCGATIGGNFEKVVLDSETENPMALEVTPDGRVLYVERDGRLRLYSPTSGTTSTAGTLPVVTTNEDGLLGIALDPDFATNRWVYLFYSPAGATPRQRISRFRLNGDLLDLSSESVLLEIPTQRDECCHSSGELEFDVAGNLYISLGDNTNPFASDGYAPIDERPGRSSWDAQRSSGNADDLRGAILRITPQDDGTYSIPNGNLFSADGSEGRPEIYVMGVRNPFRMTVDPFSGYLYWGDVGPDAGADSPLRGPIGVDEWNQARQAGNFGWPLCVGPNRPYQNYDFQSLTTSGSFDCGAPINDSPNNTGPRALPPAVPAWIWYPYGTSTDFPSVPDGNGRTAMVGPVYVYDDSSASETKFPRYYERSVILYDWSRSFLLEGRVDDNGDLVALQPFLSFLDFLRPMSMKYGPDGALYVLEWGTGFGGNNADSKLVRVEYRRGSRSPIVFAGANVRSGPVPLTVQFTSAGTYDPDPGDALTYSWDFNNDDAVDSNEPNPTFTYVDPGVYTVTLKVEDIDGNSAIASLTITAGNTIPVVTIVTPPTGAIYEWGDLVPFEVEVVDAEDGSSLDGTLDCSRVVVRPYIGHDEHSHPLDQFSGCSGYIQTAPGHGAGGDNVFHVIEVTYTDDGAGTADPLTGSDQIVLRPRRLEAEHFDVGSGVQVEPTGDVAGGGSNVGYIEAGDYIEFDEFDLTGITAVTFRVASAGPGGIIEARVDSPTGQIIGTATVEPTGNWQTYREVTAPLQDPGHLFNLYLTFRATTTTEGLFNLNWLEFLGPGVAFMSDQEGRGLFGRYYTELGFGGRSVERLDPKLNFNWGAGAPFNLIANDRFSVRWTGWIESQYSEPYTFRVRSSDGIRVRLDDTWIIDAWTDREATDVASASVEMTSGIEVPIVVEYYEQSGPAQATLSWSSPSTVLAVVPPEALTPDSVATVGVDETSFAPTEFAISENQIESLYPNPVVSQMTVAVALVQTEAVAVELVDVLGRRVAIVQRQVLEAGRRQIRIDTGTLASGTYVCRVIIGGNSYSRVVSIVR